jgi:predicted 2-oxoglutarate/Fe(II)-dependent dioxygenase YbiX
MTQMATSVRRLSRGDLIPWFRATLLSTGAEYRIDRLASERVTLLALGSARDETVAKALEAAARRPELFGDHPFVILSVAPLPAAMRDSIAKLRNILFLHDGNGAANRAAGVAGQDSGVRPAWLLLETGLRVRAAFDLDNTEHALAAIGQLGLQSRPQLVAPVLQIPDVLEAAFCRTLIERYEADGGTESGFMREVDGKTVGVYDNRHKKRSDYQITEEPLREALRARISRRIVPMIQRAFQFQVTRVERYIVARYDGQEGGHFAAHRDNTTPATAHRRFAVTINLNGDYDGGDLSFPEFGSATYRAPPGGAVVFSCSLLHEARPVTAGRRYATLPFLYDDAAAKVRQANAHTLVGNTEPYVDGANRAAAG